MVYRTVPFSMTLNDPNPVFKVTLYFDADGVATGRWKRFDNRFTRFDRIHERADTQTDKRTDRRTPHDGIRRA